MLTRWPRPKECFVVKKIGAKEGQIVGGNGDTVNGDWMKDKKNYLIG